MKLDLTPKERTPWWSLLRCCRPSDIPNDYHNDADQEDCETTLGFDSDTLGMDHVVVIGTPLMKIRSDSYSTPLTEKSTPRSSLHVILEDGHETADDQTSSASSIHFLLDDEDDDSITNAFPLDSSPFKVSDVTNGTFLFLTLAAAATTTTTTTGNLRKRRLFHESNDFESDVVEAMREIAV